MRGAARRAGGPSATSRRFCWRMLATALESAGLVQGRRARRVWAYLLVLSVALLAAGGVSAQERGTTVTVTSGTGSYTQELPPEGGPFQLDIPLAANAVNSITVTARDAAGNEASQELKITQLSLDSIVVAQASSERLSPEEVEELVNEGVIDLEDPENYNVSEFVIVLTVENEPVEVRVPVVQPKESGQPGGEERIPFPEEDDPASPPPPSPPEIVIFEELLPGPPGEEPISLPGVLYIEGRIKSLKEFFAIRLLLLNTSGIFTLSEVSARLDLPEGALTPVLPESGTVVFDEIVPGDGDSPGQAEREFIVRGDRIGVHDVTVNFGGFVTGPGIDEEDPIPFSGDAHTDVEVKGPPTFQVQVFHPDSVVASEPYDLRVDITNTGDLPALYASLDLDVGADMDLLECTTDEQTGEPLCERVEGPVSRAFGHIFPGEMVSTTFSVSSRVSGVISSCLGMADQNISLQVVVGLKGCMAGSFPPESGVPGGGPTVSVLPAPNMTGVSTRSPVTAFFSDLMNTSTITAGEGGTLRVYHESNLVPGRLRFDEVFGRTVAIWQAELPGGGLAPNTSYTVALGGGIEDQQGNALATEWTSSFSTTGDDLGDITPPELTVSVRPPVDPNRVIPGQIIQIDAYAVDQGSGVHRVEARIKDTGEAGALYELIDQRSTSGGDRPPYLFAIDSAQLLPGHAYRVLVTTYDAMANLREATASFLLASSADPPTIALADDPTDPVLQGIPIDLTPRETTGGARIVRYYLDGAEQPFKTVTLAPFQGTLRTVDLALGDHQVRALVADGLEQTGEDGLSFTLAENPSMPVVDFGSSVDGAVYEEGTAFTVAGHAEDSVEIVEVAFYLDGAKGPDPIATGTAPFLFDTTGLAPGEHAIFQVATNVLGVSNDPADPESYLEFTVVEPGSGPPPEAPVITSVSAPESGESTVNGTAMGGAKVEITNTNQELSVTVYADAKGGFSGAIAAAAGDLLSVVAYDLAHSTAPSDPSTAVVPRGPVLERIEALPSSLTFTEKGQFADLTVTAYYDTGEQRDVTGAAAYSTSEAAVATAGAAGRIVAQGSGEARITTEFEGQPSVVGVSVTIRTLTSISVAPEVVQFDEIGRHRRLSVTGHYSDGTSGPLEEGNAFSSGDRNVATVDAAGVVRAEGQGETTITVSHDGVPPVTVQVIVDTGADTDPPEVTVTEPEAGSLYGYGDTVTIVIEAEDDRGVTEIRYQTTGALDFGESETIDPPARRASATFHFDVPYGVQETDVWIHGYATDIAGNEGESAPVYIELTAGDTIPPETEGTTASNPESGRTTRVSYRVTSGLDDLDHVELFFRPEGHGTFNRYTDAPGGNERGWYHPDSSGQGSVLFDSTRMGGDGRYEFYTVGVDIAGNREAAPEGEGGAVTADVEQTIAAGTIWSVIDHDLEIPLGDTTYDGKNLRITGATVTLDGHHAFHNLRLEDAIISSKPASLDEVHGVDIEAWTMIVDGASRVDVTAQGYLGGNREGNDCTGQTAGNSDGSTYRSGGSYGGEGASYDGQPAEVYGDLTAPVEQGSGGSCGSSGTRGGSGGGSISLALTNLVLDGALSADGQKGGGNGAGSGSGGGIYLVTSTLSGSGGISARGGAHEVGGGGGRVAIHHTDISTYDTGLIEVTGGGGTWADGGNGTVFLKGIDEEDGTLVVDGQNAPSAFSRLPIPPGYVFDNIILQNSARVIADDLLEVRDALEVLTGSILTHSLSSEAGLRIEARRVFVDGTSSIDVSGKGYRGGHRDGNDRDEGLTLDGQVGAAYRSGGSYGGRGGNRNAPEGNLPYGQPDEPVHLGSGGSGGSSGRAGGNGGGRVSIHATDELTIDGSLLASGAPGGGNGAGSGSGGSIQIRTGLLEGAGTIAANGGAHEVGGGGGRIAIDYAYLSRTEGRDFDGLRMITAFGGHGNWEWGSAGTVLLRPAGQERGDLYIDDGVSGSISRAATPLSEIGFGHITALTGDTLTTDGTVKMLPGGLVGAELNPNLEQDVTFRVLANTTDTLTVDTSGGTLLSDVAKVGDEYAALYRFDNLTFRRGGVLEMGDRLLVAGTLHIDEYGRLTHYGASLESTSRLDLDVGRLEIAETGAIDLDGRGYLGGNQGGGTCSGRTAGNAEGASYRSGGSHGGLGAQYNGPSNPVYGHLTAPADLGSGGSCGASGTLGGNGGGRIEITAESMAVDGVITAGGGEGRGNGAGSGSGGTIAVSTGTLEGSGYIRANGGAREIGGGGGRVAIEYESLNLDQSHIEVLGGQGNWARAGNGTVWLKSAGQTWGELILDGHSNGSPAGSSPIPAGYYFDTITLRGGAQVLADETLSAAGAVRLLGGSVMTHTVESEPGVRIEAARLEIDATSSIDVSGRGYRGGRSAGNDRDEGLTLGGRSGAAYRSGGSYGGFGAVKDGAGSNPPYGHPARPVHLGSGGSSGSSGRAGGGGGGRVTLRLTEELAVDGKILAEGAAGGGNGAGSGSGGSIDIETGLLRGTGTISAGGAAHELGGGGGRVAILYSDLGDPGDDLAGPKRLC